MSLLKKLFGGKTTRAEPETHNGYLIFPEPVKDAAGFRIAARIEKEFDGEVKTHMMIRADTYASPETATEASLSKARQVIDQMGDRLFG